MEKISGEEFRLRLLDVEVKHVEDLVVLTRDDGESSEGVLFYTNGLEPMFGYELIGFGHYDPEDIISSATLIHSGFPRGIPVPIPYEFLKDLNVGIAEKPYRQYVVDEATLEDENEAIADEPLWVADGGYPLLEHNDLVAQLQMVHQELDKTRFENIEEVRDAYRQKIEEFGYTMVGVFDPQGDQANFVYSVGLSLKELPEYIVSGSFEMDALSDIIAHLAELSIAEGFALRKLDNVLTLDAGGDNESKYGIRVVEVDPIYARQNFLMQAAPIMKAPVARVAQVQISDAEGRFEGDEGFDNKFNQLHVGPVINR